MCPDDEVDSKLPDEHLFGKLSTKVVAIIVALILVVAAAVWAVHAFRSSGDNPADASSNSSEGDWPDINADAVPFGGSENATNGGTTDDSSKSSDATQSESKDSASDKSKKSETADSSSKKTKAKKSGDKDSSAVPQPSHENNTAFTISSANFLSNPGGQSGYAYYMHLDQPPGCRTAWLSPSAHPVVRAIFAQIPLGTPLKASRWPNSPLLKVALLR